MYAAPFGLSLLRLSPHIFIQGYVCSMYLYGSDTIWRGNMLYIKAMSSSLVPAVCTNLLIHTGLHTTDQSRSMQATRVHTYGHYRFSNSDGTSLFWYPTRALGDKSAWRKCEHNSLHEGVWTTPSQGTNAHSKLNQDEAHVQTMSLSSALAAMPTTPCLSPLRLLYWFISRPFH